MKNLLVLALMLTPFIVCVVAGVLAYNNIGGWGWFLFVVIMLMVW